MPLCADAQGLDALVEGLMSARGYRADARYSVTLPQADDDVVYTLNLHQPDSAQYLIEWSVDTPSGVNEGFSAYMPGHFYAYRNGRLREYHAEWDSLPLIGPRAVNHTTQFAQLIPSELAREIRVMAADTTNYTLTFSDNLLKALRMADGAIDAEMMWRLDPATWLPVEFSGEYNPGSISEQTVRVEYTAAEPQVEGDLSEKWLLERYPTVFEQCRQSNFAIESMPGRRVPAFSLPLTFGSDGERLTRRDTDPLNPDAMPSVVVLLDAEAGLAPKLVAEVRRAVSSVPVDVAVLYCFAGRDPELNGALLGGRLIPGEQAVNGSRRLMADCGAASLPVIMMADGEGVVRSVAIGVNNQLAADVIKMITLSTSSH
ncbi:MAG: hypothetical protein K2M97_01595 [Muribaculaceae bacterium]|nr:hypothetical protein [Muribaculaceae bacterium]